MGEHVAGDGRRGHLAATVGGVGGAAAGAWVGWESLPLLGLDGDPDLGPANLAVGMAKLYLAVLGGLTIGALVGIGAALRVAGHRRVAVTLVATVALAVPLGALLVSLAAPLAVAAPLLAGVPAAARWLVLATARRRGRRS